MLIVTRHAQGRLAERFPHIGDVAQAVQDAVTFGGQAGNSELLLNQTHGAVFVVVRDRHDLVLKTVLTQDQAIANLAIKSEVFKLWRTEQISPRQPAPDDLSQRLKELAQQDVREFDYLYPERADVKKFSKKISEKLTCSLRSVEKHYWPEILRLIREYRKSGSN